MKLLLVYIAMFAFSPMDSFKVKAISVFVFCLSEIYINKYLCHIKIKSLISLHGLFHSYFVGRWCFTPPKICFLGSLPAVSPHSLSAINPHGICNLLTHANLKSCCTDICVHRCRKPIFSDLWNFSKCIWWYRDDRHASVSSARWTRPGNQLHKKTNITFTEIKYSKITLRVSLCYISFSFLYYGDSRWHLYESLPDIILFLRT